MKTLIRTALATLAICAASVGFTVGGEQPDGPVVYVTSQGLFFDSIVLTGLPPVGPFQLFEFGGPSGFMTEWGPGDKGYVGGRWWIDANGDGMMDMGDVYFSCPLLGPGRDTP